MQSICLMWKAVWGPRRRLVSAMPAIKGHSFCLPHIAGLLVLAFLCVSCAATSVESTSPEMVQSSEHLYEQDKTLTASDMACAYFYFLWGKTAENYQRFEESLEAYEKALLCDEESVYIKRNLAILLIRMDRKEQAARTLEQIIVRNSLDTENRILLAKVYGNMGRHDEAVAIYRELLEIKEDHDTLLMLGMLYVKNKEYDNAQKMLNRLIRLEGDSYLAHYSLARLYREMQYFKKAQASYEKALALNWFERVAYEVAEFYEEMQEFDKAISIYHRIIDEGESNDLAKIRLVNLYLTLDESDKALELLRELRRILPESHNVDVTISRILLSQEKYAEAIMILEDVLKTNPELTVVRYLTGMAYYRNNENQKAVEQLLFIPAESSLYEDSIFLRVKVLSGSDNQRSAIELLQKQIDDAATRKPSYYVLLASIHREEGDFGTGRKIYEQALRLYPDNVDLLYNYGIFLEKIGEQESAMTQMKKVLQLNPDNGAALNYVGYTWADNNIHLEKALEYIRKAVELMPGDGYVRDSLGWVYFKLGDLEQAIIELEKAAAMEESDPVIREHLGDVYMRTGNPEKARSAYEEAYKLYEEEDKKDKVRGKIHEIDYRGVK